MSAIPAPKISINPPAKHRRVIPGFGLSMGYTLTYLSFIVVIPAVALVLKSMSLTWHVFWTTITGELAMSAYRLTFEASFAAAAINGIFGLIIAWVLVRYPFPGRRFFDAIIDFPFALPTAVAGITFGVMFARIPWLDKIIPGTWLSYLILPLLNPILRLVHLSPWTARAFSGFDELRVVLVLVFIGLPFVVRSVQPVLQDLEKDTEEAAASLGATRWYTFRRVIFPSLLPAWLSGLALAFARCLGEYGSVVFVSGNIPGKSQIAPQLIIDEIYNYKVPEATAIASVLLAASLLSLIFINSIQWWTKRHERT